MFDTGILSLGVLANENSVDIVVGSLKTGDRETWSDVCEKVECSSKSQVQ